MREYNEAATHGDDTAFHKRAPFLQPIGVAPASGIGAIDLRVDHGAIYATFTLGGLVTDPDGAALDCEGRRISGSTPRAEPPPAWRPTTTPAGSASAMARSSADSRAAMRQLELKQAAHPSPSSGEIGGWSAEMDRPYPRTQSSCAIASRKRVRFLL